MNKVNLYTNDGGFVVEVAVPPWKHPIELYVWGGRFFIRRQDGRYMEASGSFWIPLFSNQDVAEPKDNVIPFPGAPVGRGWPENALPDDHPVNADLSEEDDERPGYPGDGPPVMDHRFRAAKLSAMPASGSDWKGKPKTTTDGQPPEDDCWDGPAPKPIDPKTGQHGAYYVLPEEERAKGYVRPVRRRYVHIKCGAVTTMAQEIAETYARDPSYYQGGTFCVHCKEHFPVGEDGEFVWLNPPKGVIQTALNDDWTRFEKVGT